MPAATIDPVRHVGAGLSVAGDPSVSDRDGLLAGLAERPAQQGTCDAPGAGCGSALAALRNLGMSFIADASGATALMGRGLEGLRSSARSIGSADGRTVHIVLRVSARRPAATARAAAVPSARTVTAPDRLVA